MKNNDNQPTTWKDLKAVMRHQLVPSYYHPKLLHKLKELNKEVTLLMLTTNS